MPFDINKPISSKLDLDDSFTSLDSLSVDDFSLSDFTETETPQTSQNAFQPPEITELPEEIPEKTSEYKMQSVAPPTIIEAEPKINLEKTHQPQMPEVAFDSSKPPVSPWEKIAENSSNAVSLEKPPKIPNIYSDSSQEPVVPWKSSEPQQPLNAGIPPQNRKLGSGTVNFAFSDNKNIFLVVIAFAVALFFAFSIPSCTFGIFEISDDGIHTSVEFNMEFIPFLITISLVIMTIITNIIRSGEKWHYEATGREIVFSRKGKASQIIFFKDALSVDYAPYKFLGIIETGYTVTVLTYGKRHEFRYVFPNLNRKIPFDMTPFEIIRKQIDQLGLNNPDIG